MKSNVGHCLHFFSILKFDTSLQFGSISNGRNVLQKYIKFIF
jgi:hypothetical protein